MSASDPRSFVFATGQTWKLLVGTAALCIGGVIMIRAMTKTFESGNLRWMLIGTGIVLVAFLWDAFFIRCPKCKSRILWKAWAEQKLEDWGRWFFSLTSCPVCGFTPD